MLVTISTFLVLLASVITPVLLALQLMLPASPSIELSEDNSKLSFPLPLPKGYEERVSTPVPQREPRLDKEPSVVVHFKMKWPVSFICP